VTRRATILKVLIASPSDVDEEREEIGLTIRRWNAANASAGLFLEPVAWETHSFPALGDEPQSVLNKQIGDDIDLLIGVFWTRIGTRTQHYPSGTAEEIARCRAQGCPTLLYFSKRQADLGNIDTRQLASVRKLEKIYRRAGITAEFKTPKELSSRLFADLTRTVETLKDAFVDGTGGPRLTYYFPSSYDDLIASADKMFVFGVNQSDLLVRHFQTMNRRVREGCQLRVMLMDPDGDGMTMAASRFPGDIGKEHERTRALSSLDRFSQMNAAQGANVEIKIINYLMPMGGVIFERADIAHSIYVKRYTFRTHGGSQKPKYIYVAGKDEEYEIVRTEMEAMWQIARVWRPI
jgi:hypothetical protein